MIPRRLSLRFVALATIAFLVSCRTTVFTDQDFPCQTETLTPSPSSAPLEISLHVDGSSSMSGYVNVPNSRYTRTLALLDDVLLGEGSRDQIHLKYYRNSKDGQISYTREEYQAASQEKFYTGKDPEFPEAFSSLDRIITPIESSNPNDPCNPWDRCDRLLFVMTDLEQNNGDVNKFVKTLEDNYLNKNTPEYAVGVLAVRSEFDGKVYSPQGKPLFSYNTQGKQIEEYRPFYILIIGHYSDIEYYYKQMENRDEELIKKSKFVIFSPSYFVQSVNRPKLNSDLPNDIYQPFSLQKSKVAFEPAQNNQATSSYLLLEVGDFIESEQISLPYIVNFTPLPHTLNPNKIKLETQQIKVSDSFENKFIDKSDNTSLKKTLFLNNINFNNQNISLDTMINHSDFPEPAIYLYSFDLAIDTLASQPWWKESDWGSKTNPDKQPNGSKTYKFLDFMNSLKSRMTDGKDKPILTSICYAVQKN